MNQENLPEELVNQIADLINSALDIPFLNEKQEKQLFTLILSILLSTFIERTNK